MEASLFRYIWNETRREQIWILFIILASMPFSFWLLDLPKYIVNGPIQASGFEHPGDTQHYFQIRIPVPLSVKQEGFLEVLHGFDLDRVCVADHAVGRLPGAGGDQRPLQILHQLLQGPARRAHARAVPLRADGPGAALPHERVPPGEGRRGRHHDPRRGGAARRLHRRRHRAAGVPARADPHRHRLHPGAEPLSRADRARAAGRAGRGDPQAPAPPARAGPPAPAGIARAGRRGGRDRRRRRRHPHQRRLRLRPRRPRVPPRQDLRHPLRALPAQVLRQVPEQPAGAGHALPVLHGGRLPRHHGHAEHRPARGRHLGLQGPALAGEGPDRLGPAAARRRGEIRADHRAVLGRPPRRAAAAARPRRAGAPHRGRGGAVQRVGGGRQRGPPARQPVVPHGGRRRRGAGGRLDQRRRDRGGACWRGSTWWRAAASRSATPTSRTCRSPSPGGASPMRASTPSSRRARSRRRCCSASATPASRRPRPAATTSSSRAATTSTSAPTGSTTGPPRPPGPTTSASACTTPW